MMQTDILSSYNTSSPAAIAQRTRMRGLVYLGSGSSGAITYTDTVTGAILFKISVSAGDTYTINIIFPGEGILAPNGLTATFTGCTYVTTLYG